jgi:hypothetical protein
VKKIGLKIHGKDTAIFAHNRPHYDITSKLTQEKEKIHITNAYRWHATP